MRLLGPVILLVNFSTSFLCLRPKRGPLYTYGTFAVYSGLISAFTYLTGIMDTPFVMISGIIFLPITLFLFREQKLQIVFAFFLPYASTMILVSFAEMLTNIAVGYNSLYSIGLFIGLALLFLAVYMALVIRFGRRMIERLFVDSSRRVWAVYSVGAIFSFFLVVIVHWTVTAAGLHIILMFFILWSIGVLCYTIISTHEKAAQERLAKTLKLQMSTMRDQIDADKKHRDEMAILRHDIRHQAGVIAELYRSGKAQEAETVYSQWQDMLCQNDIYAGETR